MSVFYAGLAAEKSIAISNFCKTIRGGFLMFLSTWYLHAVFEQKRMQTHIGLHILSQSHILQQLCSWDHDLGLQQHGKEQYQQHQHPIFLSLTVRE